MSTAAIAEPAPVRYFGRIFVDEFEGLDAYEIAALVALRSFGPEARPAHRTLAERAGMSITRLQKSLNSLREKGRILWSVMTGTSNRYLVRDTATSVPRTEGVGATHRGGSVPRTDESESLNKRSEPENKTFPAPGARGGGEEPMGTVGGLPDDPPGRTDPDAAQKRERRDRVPREGTNEWLVRYFHNEANKAGHPMYNRGALLAHLKRLRDRHGYSNEEIMVLLRTFFIRYPDDVRSCRTNLSNMLISWTPTLMKDAKGTIKNRRKGYTPSGPRDWSKSGI